MTEDRDEQAGGLAGRLDAARRRGTVIPLPTTALASTDAYRVQAAAFGDRAIAGWKIALTSARAQVAFGTGEPAAGRLAADDIVHDTQVALASGRSYYAEAEIVFLLADDLPGGGAPLSRADVARAIGGIVGGIEFAASRFDDDDALTLPLLIADNAMADRLALGARLAERWDERFAALPVTLGIAGGEKVTGSTAAVMGDPLAALAWLANWCAEAGHPLRRGQWVSSGSCTGATPVVAGTTVSATFGAIRAVTVRLVNAQE